MSWRFLLVLLLVAAGASAWGGVRLGEWLVAHGPVAEAAIEATDLSDVPVLDADGRPFMAQPPQPLINGTLGVPEPVIDIAWHIPEQALSETTEESGIALATTSITMDEAMQIAASGNSGFQGIADVGDLGLSAADFNNPSAMAPPIPAPSPQAGGGNQAWQNNLSQELQACTALGFFDRPSCAWAARNRYCEPNNAWGRVANCPAKSF
ncbi:MAG: hypothetical protein KA735_15775 [Burkholderiaceae bacterium]|nr:hypothetical protein [Burkholderiaceae bacterium]